MAANKKGNWKVYIYGVPMRLNDPIVRRYVYLSSARAAVKRFVAEGKRAIVADDPAEERLALRNPGSSAIPANWTPATVSRKGRQIQIRVGRGR